MHKWVHTNIDVVYVSLSHSLPFCVCTCLWLSLYVFVDMSYFASLCLSVSLYICIRKISFFDFYDSKSYQHIIAETLPNLLTFQRRVSLKSHKNISPFERASFLERVSVWEAAPPLSVARVFADRLENVGSRSVEWCRFYQRYPRRRILRRKLTVF